MFQAPTKEEARALIATLVDNFERQLPDYHRGSYNETQTRREFIDPFFEALGWDVANRNGAAQAYCEVIHEDKVKVGQATKAPDYSFRLPGGQRLFFVEAKKPSVKIKEETMPAYQVRRYGWSAKLALSILTDFEELAVYDCTLQPAPTDKAARGRLKYLTFREYGAEFDFLWDTFSKESVLRGGLDKFVAAGSGKRGKETVDAAFLTTLEAMRAALAQGLATRNPRLDAEELRFLVQMLLDRVIFLRIAEDRGIEPYADLQAVARIKKKDAVYAGLLDRFKAAAARYNSGLFDLEKDPLSATVRLDNDVLAPLLQRLYYPESPYEFSVIGAEILGSAYERFLGKVISLGPGRVVRVDDKPEVRKAGGVFYTPAYIVRYMVQATLGPRCTGRTPQQVARLRVLDPACGSGSFLLGAYQYLLDWHLAYYQAHPTAALPPVPGPAPRQGAKAPARRGGGLTPDGRLSTAVKKAILLNNLYGVDLDAQAVEVTKLSLLLKCLEGETPASIQHALGLERVLPTIDQNIRVGNSLVETDFYDGELDFAPDTEKAVKPFGWHEEFAPVFQQGGFDVVIGNPPYVFGRDWKALGIDASTKGYFISKYETVRYQQDMFTLFIEKSFQLAHKNGVIAMIVPNVWLTNKFCSPLRQFVLAKSANFKLSVPQENPFPKLSVDTLIFLSEPGPIPTKTIDIVSVSERDVMAEQPIITLNAADYRNGDTPISTATTKASASIIDKILAAPLRLGDIADMTRGVHPYRTGGFGKSAFINGPQNERDVKERPYHSKKQKKGYRPFIYGRDLKRFTLVSESDYVHYGDWLAEPRNPKFFTGERVYSRKILGERLLVTLEKGESVVDQQVYITIPKTKDTSAAFLAALMGSSLASFFIKNYFDELNDAFPQVKVGQLKALPIPKLDLKSPAGRKQHDEVVGLVEQLLAGHAALPTHTLALAKEQAQAKLRHLERRLDGLVYDLYQLTPAERAHVGGGGGAG